MADQEITELTILIPCLNEEETVELCVGKALGFLLREGIDGEVLVVDNGSEDRTAELAEAAGARVVLVEERGYGSAIRGGICRAKGRYVILGDGDDSYDFSDLRPMLDMLRSGCDLVIGDRFAGGIEDGAMPLHHRYLGNPLLSWMGRVVFGSDVHDFHCGQRGFDREKILSLGLKTRGMEFASEMVVEAHAAGLTIGQIPVRLTRDGRSRRPHLRSLRDGFRHLRYLMSHPKNRFRKPLAFVLLLLWVLALAGCGSPTDKYHENISCFVLLAGVAFASLFTECGPDPEDGWGRRILGINEVLFPVVLLLAHYRMFLRIVPWGDGSPAAVLSLIVIVPGGAFVARRILLLLHEQAGRWAARPRGERIAPSIREGRGPGAEGTLSHPALIPFLLVSVVDLLFLLFCIWPGVLSGDSIQQIEQIMTGEYMDHHPYWHTQLIRLFMAAGLKLTGDINAAAAFYSVGQILIMAGAFAYIAATVYAATRSLTAWLCLLLWYVLIPCNTFFSVTMWKDIPYALAMGLFVAALFRLLNLPGPPGPRSAGHWLMLALSGLGVCLMRKNGWMVFLAAFAAFLLIYVVRNRSRRSASAKARHRRIALFMAGALILSWGMTGPAEKALGVTPGEPDEACSIPWQQMARVVSEQRQLTPEQEARLQRFIDVENIPETYWPEWYDRIKFAARAKGGDRYLDDPEKRKEFLSLWADIGKDHPLVYAAAWIEQTKGFWNGSYRNWVWLNYVDDNDYGLTLRHGSRGVFSAVNSGARLFFGPGLNVFLAIGLHLWIAWALLMVCLWYRRNAIYFVPALANALTLIMAAPMAFEFRYIYSLFVCMPILVLAAMTAPKEAAERIGRTEGKPCRNNGTGL